MSIFERSSNGLVLHTTAWLHDVHTFQWDGWTEDALAARLQECAKSHNSIAESCSILKEIILRKTGLTLYDSQLIAAYSMSQGRIAELPTGEGKTLAAVITASLFALQRKPVHILVFNDYLAQRDWNANRLIYEACGLTCGCVVEDSDFAHRKAAYACDIVYITAKEAGFDCLRDFLCVDKDRLLLSSFPVALIDEADSILIDEARIPLVLAGNAETQTSIAAKISQIVVALPPGDIGIDMDNNQVWLMERSIDTIEAKMQIDNLFLLENTNILAMVNAALEARFLLQRDKEYIVKDGLVLVVDEATGRVAENKRFPDLLHQALEIQELGAGSDSSVIYNTISMQAYLRQYEIICGMTGTAASSTYEFKQMYDLEIDVISPHTPCIRVDHPDTIYLEKNEQEAAVLACVNSAHTKGQPVLIGTQALASTEVCASTTSYGAGLEGREIREKAGSLSACRI